MTQGNDARVGGRRDDDWTNSGSDDVAADGSGSQRAREQGSINRRLAGDQERNELSAPVLSASGVRQSLGGVSVLG